MSREGRRWYQDQEWVSLYLVGLMLVALLLAVAGVGQATKAPGSSTAASPTPSLTPTPASTPSTTPFTTQSTVPAVPRPPSALPGDASRIFAPGRMLVAYYGTAGTGSLGVLGEASPDSTMPRLRRAAAAFAIGGRTVQPVFELIVRVAHTGPTGSGSYSSDIAPAKVHAYIEAAHRHGVLVVLDLQPGRANFLTVAKRWAWALTDPWVGLALDPEWRVGPRQRPAQVIGSVSAAEVNDVSRWLENLTERERLPEKIFMLHQFRTSMIRGPQQIVHRQHLAMVQHVDGFGSPRQKLATYKAVARPAQFVMGFKLFYDEDRPRMSPAAVLRINPRVRFVSFQ
jgi:hypothetical protein